MSKICKIFYHTQEYGMKKLTGPIECRRKGAWLGNGFYFWDDIEDAHDWGVNSKKRLGYYDVYHAEITGESILDTVFCDEEYRFWIKQIEKVAMKIAKTLNTKATIKEINQYLLNKAEWREDIQGVLFQDIPKNEAKTLVKSYFYKKRIQLAVYDTKIISKFALLEDKCKCE